jgi:RNA polymerase sigma-70 factor (ECF subfamily)
MTQPSAPVPIEILLSQSDWVRRLAYSLTRDPAEADDLIQETWLVVAQHPPAHDSNLKSWLRTVMKNVRRRRWRGELRRTAREHAAAGSEITDDVAELSARANMLSKVAGHVHALEEGQRAVVLLRYFDELPPRKIAEKLGVPVNTVNSRLQRAHARLREMLKDEYGDGWIAALLPLLRWPPSGKLPDAMRTGRGSRRAARWLTGAAALVVLGAGVAYVAFDGGGSETSKTASAEAGATSPAVRAGRTRSGELPSVADGSSSAADKVAATDSPPSATADAHSIRAAGSVDLAGATTGRVTLRFTSLAAAQQEVTGVVRTIETPPGPFELQLPLHDDKGRRIAAWQIDADAPDHLPRSTQARVPVPSESGDATISGIALALTPAPIATGIVTWDAAPGATARVGSFYTGRRRMQPFDLTTTASGAEFRVRMPPNERCIVVAVVEECQPVGREVDATAPGQERSAGAFALPPGNWIRGRVSAEGVALEPPQRVDLWSVKVPDDCLDFGGFWVSWDGTRARRYGAQLKAGPDGRFEAGGFEREPFRVVLNDAGRVAAEILEPVLRSPVEAPADADLAFRGTPIEVVVTSGGAPLEKARVVLKSGATRGCGGPTDAEGVSTLLGKPGVTYTLTVSKDGYATATGTVAVPESDPAPRTVVDLTPTPKEPGATWTVRVRNAAGGVPKVAGVGLYRAAKGDRFEPYPRIVRDLTPMDGAFRIEDVPPGRWQLEVRPDCTWYDAAGFETAPFLVRQLGSGESAEDEVTSVRAGRAVIDVSGLEDVEPVSWLVRMQNEAREPVSIVLAGRSTLGTSFVPCLPWVGGCDVFPALPPGRYTISADDCGTRLAGFSVSFEIVAGRVTHVPLKITRR